MADSKFLDAAVAEGVGLAEFIKRRWPDKPEYAVIRPATSGQHKGYFPAGLIAKVFDGRLDNWRTAVGENDGALIKRLEKRLAGLGKHCAILKVTG